MNRNKTFRDEGSRIERIRQYWREVDEENDAYAAYKNNSLEKEAAGAGATIAQGGKINAENLQSTSAQSMACMDESANGAGLTQNIQASQGQPMEDHVRAEMEDRMGADLEDVRIHTGGAAQQMNQDAGAEAFTYGQDIYFNKGNYNPNTSGGKELLAHELVHTVQQGKGDPGMQCAVDDATIYARFRDLKNSGASESEVMAYVIELFTQLDDAKFKEVSKGVKVFFGFTYAEIIGRIFYTLVESNQLSRLTEGNRAIIRSVLRSTEVDDLLRLDEKQRKIKEIEDGKLKEEQKKSQKDKVIYEMDDFFAKGEEEKYASVKDVAEKVISDMNPEAHFKILLLNIYDIYCNEKFMVDGEITTLQLLKASITSAPEGWTKEQSADPKNNGELYKSYHARLKVFLDIYTRFLWPYMQKIDKMMTYYPQWMEKSKDKALKRAAAELINPTNQATVAVMLAKKPESNSAKDMAFDMLAAKWQDKIDKKYSPDKEMAKKVFATLKANRKLIEKEEKSFHYFAYLLYTAEPNGELITELLRLTTYYEGKVSEADRESMARLFLKAADFRSKGHDRKAILELDAMKENFLDNPDRILQAGGDAKGIAALLYKYVEKNPKLVSKTINQSIGSKKINPVDIVYELIKLVAANHKAGVVDRSLLEALNTSIDMFYRPAYYQVKKLVTEILIHYEDKKKVEQLEDAFNQSDKVQGEKYIVNGVFDEIAYAKEIAVQLVSGDKTAIARLVKRSDKDRMINQVIHQLIITNKIWNVQDEIIINLQNSGDVIAKKILEAVIKIKRVIQNYETSSGIESLKQQKEEKSQELTTLRSDKSQLKSDVKKINTDIDLIESDKKTSQLVKDFEVIYGPLDISVLEKLVLDGTYTKITKDDLPVVKDWKKREDEHKTNTLNKGQLELDKSLKEIDLESKTEEVELKEGELKTIKDNIKAILERKRDIQVQGIDSYTKNVGYVKLLHTQNGKLNTYTLAQEMMQYGLAGHRPDILLDMLKTLDVTEKDEFILNFVSLLIIAGKTQYINEAIKDVIVTTLTGIDTKEAKAYLEIFAGMRDFKKMPDRFPLNSEVSPFPEGFSLYRSFGFYFEPRKRKDGTWRVHSGGDLSSDENKNHNVRLVTPVKCVYKGTVVFVLTDSEKGDARGYGGEVVIYHGNFGGQDLFTRYAHMGYETIDVTDHLPVERGDVLGKMSGTGKGKGVEHGAHLHYEVLVTPPHTQSQLEKPGMGRYIEKKDAVDPYLLPKIIEEGYIVQPTDKAGHLDDMFNSKENKDLTKGKIPASMIQDQLELYEQRLRDAGEDNPKGWLKERLPYVDFNR